MAETDQQKRQKLPLSVKFALFCLALTSLLFMAGKFVIAMYIERSKVGGAYGPASAIVVLLMWVYYASLIVLMGAELSHGLAQVRGERERPAAHARSTQ